MIIPVILQTALVNRNLIHSRLDAPKLFCLSSRQVIKCAEGDVQALCGMVDSEDVDASAIVGRLPACTAVWRVPTADRLSTSYVREALNLSLCLPAILSDEAVGAVRAGHRVKSAVGVIVSPVV